ncbi:MAG: hypothetical protein FIB08_12800 [Candidatus Methanoperedens sp.]|nr:hypothetical protein [Candidatus Methanoperedens sp.]
MKKKQKTKSKKKPDLKLIAYYAHSMQKYGSTQEKEELNFISKLLGICTVINPALIEYDGNGMQQYFEIIDACNIVIFSEYKKHIGKGVHSEIEYALSNNKPVFLLRGKILYECKDEMCRIINPDDWRVIYARVILPKEINATKITQNITPLP